MLDREGLTMNKHANKSQTFSTTIVLTVINGISRDSDGHGQFTTLLLLLDVFKILTWNYEINPRCLFKKLIITRLRPYSYFRCIKILPSCITRTNFGCLSAIILL